MTRWCGRAEPESGRHFECCGGDGPGGSPGGSQDGAVGVVLLFAVAVFSTVALAGLAAAADLSLAAARSRAAADAAALAGVGRSPLVDVPASTLPTGGAHRADAAARTVAAANGARFVRGHPTGWPLRYGVTVEVAPLTDWVSRIVGPVRAKATGGVRPRAGCCSG